MEGTRFGDNIEIYTVGGQIIGKHLANDNVVRLTLNPDTTYIIRINDHAVKVII